MKTDKVFVLLLVILLPLTGCIDMADNAESQDATTEESQNETNHLPVIFGDAYFGNHYCSSDSSTKENMIITRAAYAVDFDGNITEFGLDVNQDGSIDYTMDMSCENADYQPMMGTNSTEWMNPIPMNTWGSMDRDVEYCYQDLALVAIDDDGGMTVNPFRVIFDYDNNDDMVCLLEPN